MNALEEMKKRAEEAKLAEASEQLKEKQTRTREMLEAEIKAKEAIIDNFSPKGEDEFIKNKEQFFNIIDMIADVGILEVEKTVEHYRYGRSRNDQELKDFVMSEFALKIDNLKEETKLKIMNEFDYLTGDRPATSERKHKAMNNIRSMNIDLRSKLREIRHDSYKKVNRYMPAKTVVIFFLLSIAIAVIGIALHSLILSIVGELLCMVLFAIQYHRYPGDLDMNAKAGAFLFVLSIVFGIVFKSFFVGLFGCIAAILYGVFFWFGILGEKI